VLLIVQTILLLERSDECVGCNEVECLYIREVGIGVENEGRAERVDWSDRRVKVKGKRGVSVCAAAGATARTVIR
jgi:hypothetical protein